MKILATFYFLTALSLHAQPVYLGTGADGIYLTQFDAEAGSLSQPTLVAQFKEPGFLAIHPEKPILYSIGGENKVGAFTIAPDATLTLLAEAPCGGSGPCHLAVDSSGRSLAIANYSSGSITTIRLAADGSFGPIISEIKIQGSGPNPDRQTQPHAHGVYFDRANRFLFAPDLGTDQTLIFQFDPATSALTAHTPPSFTAPPGSGPRHMAFSPDQKHAYIINELTNTISATAFDQEKGSLTAFQTITTLPVDFTGTNTTAEIEIHPSGDFAYASNRGHNTIAVFRRDPATGLLTFLQHAPCGGDGPRHFKIDPSGKWLLCGHQKSNTLSVLPLDSQTGLLGAPQSTVETPSPICILFP